MHALISTPSVLRCTHTHVLLLSYSFVYDKAGVHQPRVLWVPFRTSGAILPIMHFALHFLHFSQRIVNLSLPHCSRHITQLSSAPSAAQVRGVFLWHSIKEHWSAMGTLQILPARPATVALQRTISHILKNTLFFPGNQINQPISPLTPMHFQ